MAATPVQAPPLRCHACGSVPARPARCAACKTAVYCDAACQRHAWRNLGHAAICGSLAAGSEPPRGSRRAFVRDNTTDRATLASTLRGWSRDRLRGVPDAAEFVWRNIAYGVLLEREFLTPLARYEATQGAGAPPSAMRVRYEALLRDAVGRTATARERYDAALALHAAYLAVTIYHALYYLLPPDVPLYTMAYLQVARDSDQRTPLDPTRAIPFEGHALSEGGFARRKLGFEVGLAAVAIARVSKTWSEQHISAATKAAIDRLNRLLTDVQRDVRYRHVNLRTQAEEVARELQQPPQHQQQQQIAGRVVKAVLTTPALTYPRPAEESAATPDQDAYRGLILKRLFDVCLAFTRTHGIDNTVLTLTTRVDDRNRGGAIQTREWRAMRGSDQSLGTFRRFRNAPAGSARAVLYQRFIRDPYADPVLARMDARISNLSVDRLVVRIEDDNRLSYRFPDPRSNVLTPISTTTAKE